MCTCARALFGLESRKANTGRVDSGSFRQPVVRSGGAVRRRGVALRRIPFRAGDSLVAPVRPSPAKDAFSIRRALHTMQHANFLDHTGAVEDILVALRQKTDEELPFYTDCVRNSF